MKKIATSLAVILFTFSPFVQAQKIAHISLDSLLNTMPETKKAKEASQEYYKQLEGQIGSMQGELQKKYQEYQENQTKYTELVKQTKEKELQDLNQRIQDFQQSAQMDIQKKNDELTKPVYDKAKKAIDQVAKENGYKYVLDTSAGLVLYSEPGDDIIALVMKKLGISAASPAPEATPEKKK